MAEVTSTTTVALATESANEILSKLKDKDLLQYTQLKHPQIGIICGSGLGKLAETLHKEPQFELSYSNIRHFPRSTVTGHEGKFVFGLLGEKKTPVVMMVGRVHFFEGYSIEKVTFPTRVMKILGIKAIIVTNAAGGLNSAYSVGDIMILNDHINLPGLSGSHPLRGPNEDAWGLRFPPLSDAYDLEFRKTIHLSYKKLPNKSADRKLHEGVYAFVSGPSYETRAECRMLKMMGADCVGMSTVPEIIVARHCGIRVLAMSLVTNNAVLEEGPRGDEALLVDKGGEELVKAMEIGKATHSEVLETGTEASKDMQALVKQFVDDIAAKGFSEI